jgi:hypothetical protein
MKASSRMAVIAAVLFVAVSGCATLAQSPATLAPTGAQRRECERNAGAWSTAAGYCRVGQ